MTTKNTKMLGCRIPNEYYESFTVMAKDKGWDSPGAYLKDVVMKAVNKHFNGREQEEKVERSASLTQGAVWYRPGVKYAAGQKVLVKQKGGGVATVIAPELDVDGNPVH